MYNMHGLTTRRFDLELSELAASFADSEKEKKDSADLESGRVQKQIDQEVRTDLLWHCLQCSVKH